MSTHFTAILIIEEVVEAEPPRQDQYGKVTANAVPRKTSEVAKVVLRNDTIDGLKEKIAAHTELV